jgi:hypothetical protein
MTETYRIGSAEGEISGLMHYCTEKIPFLRVGNILRIPKTVPNLI